MTAIVQGLLDALTLGSFYALFALGIALIFGIMQLVNFAHGELIMIGAYVLFVLNASNLWVGIFVAVVIVVGFALGMERLAFRPVRLASPATMLITSFAVSFFLQSSARLIFTTLPRSVDLSDLFRQSVELGGLRISWLSIITLATNLVLLPILALFLTRSRLGTFMRAAAEDFEMARLCGVPANRVIATSFAISGVLAAVAAILLVGQTGSLSITMGLTPILFGFTAAAIGGLGHLVGAVVGGYLLGVVATTLQQILPSGLAGYRDAFLFLAVFVLLALKPGGLFRVPAFETRF